MIKRNKEATKCNNFHLYINGDMLGHEQHQWLSQAAG